MRIVTFPALRPLYGGEGPVQKFLSSLKRKRADLWTLVDQQMRTARNLENLRAFELAEIVGRLGEVKAPLYEFRIPKTRRGGVVRIYFCYRTEEPGCIILLDAELKKGHAANIDSAEKRYRELYG